MNFTLIISNMITIVGIFDPSTIYMFDRQGSSDLTLTFHGSVSKIKVTQVSFSDTVRSRSMIFGVWNECIV